MPAIEAIKKKAENEMKRLAPPNPETDKVSQEYAWNANIEQVGSELVNLLTQLNPGSITKGLKTLGMNI